MDQSRLYIFSYPREFKIFNDLVQYTTQAPGTSDASETNVTRVLHKCHTNDTSATRVKNVDFDKDTNKNIFSYSYIYYMASERLQGEEQFHSKKYILEMLVPIPKCV